MTAAFTLELDTHAPEVTFGYARQPEYNEDFVVPFALNEKGIVDAWLEDAEGQRHPLIVRNDSTLWRFVDANVATGPALVQVQTRDDVLNEAVWGLRVEVGRHVVLVQSDSTWIALVAEDHPDLLHDDVSDCGTDAEATAEDMHVEMIWTDSQALDVAHSTSEALQLTATIELVP